MKDKLLLHACCAPCSSAIIEQYSKYFDITLYYYNPCITDEEEYNKRANELIRLVKEMNVSADVCVARYTPEKFYVLNPLKDEPEGGTRCISCYAQRLSGTAIYAKDNGFNYFFHYTYYKPI